MLLVLVLILLLLVMMVNVRSYANMNKEAVHIITGSPPRSLINANEAGVGPTAVQGSDLPRYRVRTDCGTGFGANGVLGSERLR
jgi:hypothetical protein